MKTLKFLILMTAPMLLNACDSEPDDVAVEPVAEVTGAPQAEAAPAQSSGPVDMIKVAGRWKTPVDAVEKGKWVVIDLTSEGDFSMDVRALESGKEAILEGTTGKAKAEGNVVKGGFAPDASGVHIVLKKYSSWTLDPSGNLLDAEGKPVKIAKE